MGYTYYAAGGCNGATLGQTEIFKMASKMAAATRQLLLAHPRCAKRGGLMLC